MRRERIGSDKASSRMIQMLHAICGSFASMDNRTPAMDRGVSMDARKCSSEPCICLVEKNPRMTLADPWMGVQLIMKKLKFSNDDNHDLVVANTCLINQPINSMKSFASTLEVFSSKKDIRYLEYPSSSCR